MTYTIEKITTLIGARRYGNQDSSIRWLLTDSRSLCFPEETLFFALRTNRNDGHKYIGDLYRRGVRNFVVETIPAHADDVYPKANFLKVVKPLEALQRLAERHRDEFNIPIVGITGSNGKTMVKEWLYQLLSGVGLSSDAERRKQMEPLSVTRSPKSFNSQIGVPLSVWLLNENTRVGLFEAGISEPGEMDALRDIIQPTIGVFTSLGSAHQENFRSLEEKCTEKLLLFHDASAVVYCSDDAVVSRCMRRSGYKGEKLTWSRENKDVVFYLERVEQSALSTKVYYIYKGEKGAYEIPFIDEASVDNSVTCALTALQLGISMEELAERMPALEPVAMRLEVKEGQRGCTLINDSYNSDVNSLSIALDFMNRREEVHGEEAGNGASSKKQRTTLVLSDIDQSGESAESLYEKVVLLLEGRGVDKFIGIGSEISKYLVEHTKQLGSVKIYAFQTTEEFLTSAAFRELRNEVILLKGARRFGFERITEQLEKKVHETILEVNLNALVENLNYYRSFLKRDTKMVCMIKADGYGAGAVEIAKTLQDHRVDYLAVAVADEGVTLRKAGITSNIMIMNPEMTSFKTMFDYDLEPEVYSFRLLDALIKAARKEGITGWPVHIKLDTGMHRLGFNPQTDMDELIDRLKHQQAIIPKSVFSHFVGSDSDDFDQFSARQFKLFDEGSKKLQAAFGHTILRHMNNSAGIEHFPERQMDMCRLGIGLYGVNPRDNQMLHTVSTLKTTILQLRHVPATETVGYSRKGKLSRDSVIAAIPIGYADGLNRHLGCGKCYCLVNGEKAPYIGNICMDVALIDVTDIACKEGDSVEIFGENLPVTVLSDCLDTIPYEVLTGISNRVKRVYYQD
ncbi:MAG: bifunctional UDP-N-acetylmuramoyl-tripeptide:D-alanyl-D-alanine ligase/alanine racemase [Prevotella sp.]|nr:bifunctional UDP-N-acetylmuramoyl-tripeptide:D-alanyl-D-alanine ligase/alanine racemase [Prevotella sp.]